MVNYNLAEFKKWFKENRSREENLDWTILNNETWDDTYLEKFLEGKEFYKGIDFQHDFWKPYREVALKWKVEVDEKTISVYDRPRIIRGRGRRGGYSSNRERERERERAGGWP